MKFFKNTELAKLYNVSEKSVRNWIQAASEGKLDLELYEHNGKPFIANISRNTLVIEQLVQKGKKYKNTRSYKVVNPSKKFYKTYSQKQIFDIISSLTIHKELPLKYSYVDGGASYWDRYAQRLLSEESPNILTRTIELLNASKDSLEYNDSRKVNVIDLGPGNGLAVKELLEHLVQTERLERYVAIDISQELIDITRKNIYSWFGDRVEFEGHVRDFSHERFDDLFAEDYAGNDSDIPLNLVLMFGGTLCNFRSPKQSLQAINNSLGLDDLFIYSMKLDTPNSRRFFDFNIAAQAQELSPRHRLALDLLNIDDSYYMAQQLFNPSTQARTISIVPKVDLTIEFELSKGVRAVTLQKDQPILLWRSWHWNTLDVINIFDECEFDLQQVIKSKDQEYLLLVSRLKQED